MPWICVSFKNANVMIVTDIANTVKNPVFIPKIRKSKEAISSELPF